MERNIYCVYLTHYSGDILPPYYVGSSSFKSLQNGYKGSVGSKKYKTIWDQEIKNNPHLFKTIILSFHNTRVGALKEELRFQKENKTKKSSQ